MKAFSRTIRMILASAMAFSLAVCGSSSAAAEPTASAATAAAEESASGNSGEVTVYMPSPSGLNEKYVSGFEAATGIKVNLFEGTTGEILARLEAEKDNPVADVVVLASWSDGLRMKKQGGLVSYPDAKNADKLYDGWKDEDNMLFGTSASALGVIYNTTLIDSLDADWSDLASDKYKDMIAIPDPTKSGSCKDFLAGYMNATNEDWSAFEGMAANGMTVAGANKAALETVLTGEKAILVAGVDYNAYANIAKGEPINIYYPASGTIINPRPAMILSTAKNMDNAKAFIDYLMSDEAQKLVANAYLLPGRSDISCDNRTNVADIPQLDHDWSWMMDHADDVAAKLVSICQK